MIAFIKNYLRRFKQDFKIIIIIVVCLNVFFILLFSKHLVHASISSLNSAILVPMDKDQTEHLQAYGVVYRLLENNVSNVYWLLNFRGGSFLLPYKENLTKELINKKIVFKVLLKEELRNIETVIENENMELVELEIAPKLAIYLSSSVDSDVVARLLKYVQIPFRLIYDEEILQGKLAEIDWLHVHHKDFTGQDHKSQSPIERGKEKALGYEKLWQLKQNVALAIHKFVENGGFLFAMCSAAETLDVALAAYGIDIAPVEIDGDPPDPLANSKLNYDNTFAFRNFTIYTSINEKYSDIDMPQAGLNTYFTLFDFSAKVDKIPTLLNQNHNRIIRGFSGETTSFKKSLIKKNITILAENSDNVSVRYLMGFLGKGFFTFYGGHTPGELSEDYKRSADGFRLILNNVLFPSANLKKKKT